MKSIFTSKTFWTNLLAMAVIIAQGLTGSTPEWLTIEAQATILSVINIILRTVTKEEVTWK